MTGYLNHRYLRLSRKCSAFFQVSHPGTVLLKIRVHRDALCLPQMHVKLNSFAAVEVGLCHLHLCLVTAPLHRQCLLSSSGQHAGTALNQRSCSSQVSEPLVQVSLLGGLDSVHQSPPYWMWDARHQSCELHRSFSQSLARNGKSSRIKYHNREAGEIPKGAWVIPGRRQSGNCLVYEITNSFIPEGHPCHAVIGLCLCWDGDP